MSVSVCLCLVCCFVCGVSVRVCLCLVCFVCLYVFVLGSGWLPPRGDPGNTVIICCG